MNSNVVERNIAPAPKNDETETSPDLCPTKTCHPLAFGRSLVPSRRKSRRRSSTGLGTRTAAALELNNCAVVLLEASLVESPASSRRRGDGGGVISAEESAIDALRDAIEALASESPLASARAEARLELAAGEARKARSEAAKRSATKTTKIEEKSLQSSAFVCAKPIKMSAPQPTYSSYYGDYTGATTATAPSLQGLLSVVSYNLGLAHQLLGRRVGRQSLVNKATQFYKKSEAIVLSIADAAEDSGSGADSSSLMPPGVDVTYLARAIVNNMGMILFEWGEPDAGREYFEGLNSISVEFNQEEESDTVDKDDGSKWRAFAVNALIARGSISSCAA